MHVCLTVELPYQKGLMLSMFPLNVKYGYEAVGSQLKRYVFAFGNQ